MLVLVLVSLVGTKGMAFLVARGWSVIARIALIGVNRPLGTRVTNRRLQENDAIIVACKERMRTTDSCHEEIMSLIDLWLGSQPVTYLPR